MLFDILFMHTKAGKLDGEKNPFNISNNKIFW